MFQAFYDERRTAELLVDEAARRNHTHDRSIDRSKKREREGMISLVSSIGSRHATRFINLVCVRTSYDSVLLMAMSRGKSNTKQNLIRFKFKNSRSCTLPLIQVPYRVRIPGHSLFFGSANGRCTMCLSLCQSIPPSVRACPSVLLEYIRNTYYCWRNSKTMPFGCLEHHFSV